MRVRYGASLVCAWCLQSAVFLYRLFTREQTALAGPLVCAPRSQGAALAFVACGGVLICVCCGSSASAWGSAVCCSVQQRHGSRLHMRLCNMQKPTVSPRSASRSAHSWLSTVRSGEWPAWLSFWFSGRWRALAKGTAWAGFYSKKCTTTKIGQCFRKRPECPRICT